MNDKEAADLQDQVKVLMGILDKRLALIGQIHDILDVQSTVLQEHLQAHKDKEKLNDS